MIVLPIRSERFSLFCMTPLTLTSLSSSGHVVSFDPRCSGLPHVQNVAENSWKTMTNPCHLDEMSALSHPLKVMKTMNRILDRFHLILANLIECHSLKLLPETCLHATVAAFCFQVGWWNAYVRSNSEVVRRAASEIESTTETAHRLHSSYKSLKVCICH